MRSKVLVFVIGILGVTCRSASCYSPPDQIEMAKRLYQVEQLARDHTKESMEKLVSISLSESESLPARRLACRFISQIGTSEVLKGKQNLISTSDLLGPSWRLAETVVAMRERGDAKQEIAKTLLSFWTELTKTVPGEDKEASILRGIRQSLAAGEIAFQIADLNLPADGFPSVIRSRPEVVFHKLRAQYAGLNGPSERSRWISEQLSTEDPAIREAAARLLAEEGEAVLPQLIAILQSNLPTSDGPPFTSKHRAYSAALEVLAGIGGDGVAAVLTVLIENEVGYVAENAKFYLRWVNAGVLYPVRYKRLLNESPIDE